MTLLLLSILIPLFINVNNSKFINIFSLFFSFLLFGFCVHTNDTSIYLNRYYDWDNSWRLDITEPLYTWTVAFFRELNFSYQDFFCVVAAVFVICLTIFINKLTKKISYVVGFILLSIYPMLVTLQRTTYSFCFVLLAFYCLFFCRKSFIKAGLFSVLIIMSSMIHSMCILFLIFGVAYFIETQRLKKYLIIAFVSLVIFVSLINILFQQFFSYLNMSEKYDLIMTQHSGDARDTFVITVLAILRVLSVIVLPIGIDKILSRNYKVALSVSDRYILKLNYVGFLLCPLVYIEHDFYRILYPFAIMNFCLASHYLKYNYCKWYSLFCCLNIGYWFIYRPAFEHVFLEVYSNNSIFDFM